jgi:hypothetical protein
MKPDRLPSRRAFLRVAVAAPILGTTAGRSQAAAQGVSTGAAGSVISRIALDQEIYNSDGVLNGHVSFRLPASGAVILRWVDSFDRVVQQVQLPASTSGVSEQGFCAQTVGRLSCD